MVEGHDWSQPPFVRKVYRWPFGKTFVIMAPLMLVTIVLSTVVFEGVAALSWERIDWIHILTFGLIYPLIFSFINYQFWSIVLTPETIGASSGLRTFRLENIETVARPWHSFGLFVVVKQKGGWLKLSIPMFMDDMDDFVRSLEQVAPESNPLRQYFRSLEERR